MKTLRILPVLALAAAGFVTSPAIAQEELSEDEIARRLILQARERAEAQPELGATRGLTLNNGGQGGAGDAAQIVDTGYSEVEPDNQVNLRIIFEFDSAAIAANQQPKLARMCNVMKTTDINMFRIIGHTDAKGSVEYNEQLSKLRAEEVKRYLTSADCGIAENRLEAIGVGEEYLFDNADPDNGVNRRVEFQALS